MITIPYVLAVLALLIVPGPSVVPVISRAVLHGRRAAILTVCGNVLAVLCVTVLVVLGLGALLQAVPLAFDVIKYAGAAYLVYLGVKALRDRDTFNFEASDTTLSTRQFITRGFAATLLNPKLAVFFAAFLPQFVHPEAGNITGQMLALGTTFAALAFLCDSTWGMLAASAGAWLKRSARAMRALRWFSGLTFIGLGARLALEER
jgi:threonine/homoserine/homoserine lactone efflux protein